MRPNPFFVVTLLLLGACAPQQATVSGPAPTAPPPAEVSVAEPDEVLVVAPNDWWLLDASANGVFGTSAERAYRELLDGRQPRRSVVVAILDSGVDIEHEDLDDNLWVNEGEVPGNGRDDDGNGYVDDVHGWNFIGGPGGTQVHQDTYEVTRLYADCRERHDTGAACRALEAEFEARRAEAQELLQQYSAMSTAMQHFTALLRQHLGTDSLTAAAVGAIRTLDPQLQQAQQVYMRLAAAGVDEDDLKEGVKALTTRVEYHLNLEFDPRPIVGDDYEDGTQRFYGNNVVEGPAADHGTHVAGIVAAERGNGVGVDGIANAARLMIVRTVPDGDERDKDVANAIRYAADNGAHIINMSFGKSHSPQKALVDEAVRHAESRGVLLVHAAGNDAADLNTEPNFPTRYYEDGGEAELWIEVGASTWSSADSLAASFSNYGREEVDVFAPGVAILSTVPGDEYDISQGTSMAAPVVSGLAALIMAYYPELTAAQVKEVILETATPYREQAVVRPGGKGERIPFGQLSATGGIVNAYAALQRAAQVASGGR